MVVHAIMKIVVSLNPRGEQICLAGPYFTNSFKMSKESFVLYAYRFNFTFLTMKLLDCDHAITRAYPDCNQYFTGVSGNVNSYNWPTVQLQSKSHNICIRKEAGNLNQVPQELPGLLYS